MRALPSLLPVAISLLVPACGSDGGGGGGGGGAPSPAEVVFFISDAPTDDLIRLQGSLNSVVLFDDAGGSTGNVLANALYPMNLIGLDLGAVPVGATSIPAGRYVSAFLSFSTPTLSARTKNPILGEVPVVALPAISASFLAPLDLAPGDLAGIVLDIDLVRSAILDPGSGGLVFLPNQRPGVLAAGGSVELFDGIVRRVRKSKKLLEVDVTSPEPPVAPNPPVSLGVLDVIVDNNDLLVGAGGTPFSGLTPFFGAVEVGDRIAVSGAWNSVGFVDASFVRIETGSGNVVEIDGRVLFVNSPGQTFLLQIASVRSGKPIVDGAFAMLGNTSAVNVLWDGLTSFLLLDPAGAASGGALAVGQEVRVRFDAFAAMGPPVTVTTPAAAVEILDSDEIFEGVVTDTSALPVSVEVTLDPTDPHVLGLLVSTPLPFELGGIAPPRLRLGNGPVLSVNDFQVGQRVWWLGVLTGTAPSQTVVAAEAEVLPGRISDSVVTSVNPSTSRFTCTFDSMTEPVDPFGGAPPASPVTVQVEPGALLLGPLGSPINLMEFQNLSAQFGPNLHADFQGINSPSGTFLRAFDVRLTVQ